MIYEKLLKLFSFTHSLEVRNAKYLSHKTTIKFCEKCHTVTVLYVLRQITCACGNYLPAVNYLFH